VVFDANLATPGHRASLMAQARASCGGMDLAGLTDELASHWFCVGRNPGTLSRELSRNSTAGAYALRTA
jgi:hypothetical protein